MQSEVMKFDPATGGPRPYPSHAGQWREWHGKMAWLFNPWTGRRRDARDVGSDVQGLLIVPAGTLGMDMGGGCVEKDNAAQVTRLKNDAAIFYEAAAGLLATNDALRTQLAEAQRNALGSHDVREPTSIGCAVNRAARDLPEGWEIRIYLERHAGVVFLIDPDGNETMSEGGELFSDQINAAIDAAKGPA